MWTRSEDAHLRALWDAGMTATAIAAAMGVTKNAVLGRAHRMKLAARPSPIGAAAAPRAPRLRAPARAKAPRLAPPAAPAPVPPVPRPRPPAVAGGAAAGCQWPMWAHAERPPHPPRFCDAPVARRGNALAPSYCAAHGALAVERRTAGPARGA